MIKQGHIDRSEAILILWFTLGGKVLLTFPASMTAEGLSAGWMVIAFGGLLALAAFVPGVAFMRRFPGLSFARAADEAGGLVVGKAASLAVALLFLALAGLTLREFAEAFVTSILPRTPVPVIIVTFALAVAYSAYGGLEVMGRLTIFLTPWLLIFLGVVLLGNAPDMNYLRLFPLWGTGVRDILAAAPLRSSLYAEILILPVLFPYLRERRHAASVGVWAVSLSILMLVAIQVAVTMVFDVLGTDRLAFPIIDLARLASFGRFLSRIEALVVLLWIFVAAIGLAAFLWAGATTLAEALRLPDHRPLFAPLTALVAAGSLLPRGLEQAALLDFEFARRWAWVLAYALPAALWLLAAVRGKKTPPGGKQGGEAGHEPVSGT